MHVSRSIYDVVLGIRPDFLVLRGAAISLFIALEEYVSYRSGDWKVRAFLVAICIAIFATLSFAAESNMKQIANGQKAKVKGKITAHNVPDAGNS